MGAGGGFEGGDPHAAGEGAPGSRAWLEALVRARLGPGAALGSIAFEGRLVHLREVRVPLGGAATLEAEAISVELGRGAALGGLPLAARLSSIAGRLLAAGAVVPLRFDASDDDGASWVHGTLGIGPAEGTLRLGPSPSGGVAVELSLATGSSALRARGELRGASLDDAHVTGQVATSDVASLLGASLPDAVLELDLALRGPLADPKADGHVLAKAVRLRGAAGSKLVLGDVSARVEVDRLGLRFRELQGTARGARFGGWGRVAFGPPSIADASVPRVALQIERAPATLCAEIAALRGVALPLAKPNASGLPPDLVASGELVLADDGALSGSCSVETPRSSLLLNLVAGARDRALLGSTLRGRVAAADAIALGLFPDAVHPRAEDVLQVDARLGGTLARPGIAGRLAASRLSVVTGDGGPVLEIDDASVLLDVGRDGLRWQQLSARLYGGTVRSSGRIARATGVLDASISWRDVRLDAVPTAASGESALAGVLGGSFSGEVRLERASRAKNALRARGHVSLASPVYPVVRSLSERLARYGLPAIEARGTSPATASLRLEHGELVVEPIAIALDGLDVEGVLRVRDENRVLGRVAVRLRPSYLGRSPILAIPSAFAGDVVIPIYVLGTVGDLDVQTDALEILDGLLLENPVGEAVRDVWDGLWGTRRPSRPRR